MTGYPAHSWSYVVDSFRELAADAPRFVPMRELVERLAASGYAAALYPQQSMQTLRLSQHAELSSHVERLSVEHDGAQFVVRYQGGPTAPVWTKHHPDGMIALERAFEHLRWFTEYRERDARPAI